MWRHFGPFATLVLSSLAWSQTQIVLENRASVIATPTFKTIEVVEQQPGRLVVEGRSKEGVRFIAVMDEVYRREAFDPVKELLPFLGEEEMQFVGEGVSRSVVIQEYGSNPMTTQVVWLKRTSSDIPVHFFLIGNKTQVEAAERDFKATADAFTTVAPQN